MDGNFTKVLYTTPHFTVNGLCFEFPVENAQIQCFPNSQKYNGETKYIMKFDPVTGNNKTLLENICEIEKSLLNYYLEYMTKTQTKRKVYGLSEQLLHGSARFYSRFPNPVSCASDQRNPNPVSYASDQRNPNPNHNYLIKISGIWENNQEIGITYKILEK
jgi:hypothetical protein